MKFVDTAEKTRYPTQNFIKEKLIPRRSTAVRESTLMVSRLTERIQLTVRPQITMRTTATIVTHILIRKYSKNADPTGIT